MRLLSPLLFGISANLDALLIGASYGLRQIRITFLQNLLISLITFVGSFLSVALGRLLGPILSVKITAYAGSALLILFGCYLLYKALLHKLQASATDGSPTQPISLHSQENASLSLTYPEILVLGGALSLNNIGIGFGTGLTGIAMLPTMLATLFLSVLFMTLGNRMGVCGRFRRFAQIADPISGILLIGLGILQLVL